MLSNKWLQGVCLTLICGLSAQAKEADKLVALPIDYIVAIVNEDVITHSELSNKLTTIMGQLKNKERNCQIQQFLKTSVGTDDY